MELSEESERRVGKVGNAYGFLNVNEGGGKFYWGMDNYDGILWEEIPEYLFVALNSHQDELDK